MAPPLRRAAPLRRATRRFAAPPPRRRRPFATMVQLTTLCVHILLCNGISTMKRQDAASEYQQPSKSPRISAAKSKPGMRALGNAVYRSTLPPHKGAVLDLHQQLLPKAARVQAVIRCGAVQPTQWRLTGSRGENWLLNPGHVMGLHAVVERLCFDGSCGGASCVTARELVQTFVTACNQTLSALGGSWVKSGHLDHVKQQLRQHINIVTFQLRCRGDRGRGTTHVEYWLPNLPRLPDELILATVNTISQAMVLEARSVVPTVSAEQLRVLKRALPKGMAAVIDFVASAVNPAAAETLGIKAGRARSVGKHPIRIKRKPRRSQ